MFKLEDSPMKKFLLVVLIISGVIGGLTQDSILWSYRLFLDQPIIHNLEKGEYLSQLSIKYYGSPDYWRALALINRAPNPDLVHPKESIIIPDLESVKKLNKARTITEVNKLVGDLEYIMSQSDVQQELEVAPIPQKQIQPVIEEKIKQPEESQIISTPYVEPKSSSMMPVVFFIIVGLVIGGGIAYWIIKRRKVEYDEREFESESEQEFKTIEEIETDKPFENRHKKTLEEALAS